jgi:hypothetical protein
MLSLVRQMGEVKQVKRVFMSEVGHVVLVPAVQLCPVKGSVNLPPILGQLTWGACRGAPGRRPGG